MVAIGKEISHEGKMKEEKKLKKGKNEKQCAKGIADINQNFPYHTSENVDIFFKISINKENPFSG